MSTIDPAGARGARDAGLGAVREKSGTWFDRAMAAVIALAPEWVGTGEDLRLLLTERCGPPHSHYVWGALIAQAVEREYLHPTGRRVPMRTVKSHARRTDVYRRRRITL